MACPSVPSVPYRLDCRDRAGRQIAVRHTVSTSRVAQVTGGFFLTGPTGGVRVAVATIAAWIDIDRHIAVDNVQDNVAVLERSGLPI